MRGFAALGRARVLASWTLWIAPEISPSSPFLRGGALLCSPWLLRLRSRLTNDRERLPQARARSCRCDRVGAHGSSGLPGGREDLRDAGLSGRVVGHGVASAGRSGSVHPGRSARVCSGERRLGGKQGATNVRLSKATKALVKSALESACRYRIEKTAATAPRGGRRAVPPASSAGARQAATTSRRSRPPATPSRRRR